jgi:aminomethyltransferase
VGDSDFLVMPNASNTAPLVGALADAITDHAEGTCSLEDITESRAILAVQGPEARTRLREIEPAWAGVKRFAVQATTFDGVGGWVAGTGYTGEDGVELHVPAEQAPAVWNRLVESGLTPAGLGARDTLRLEAGLPLHGHELGPGITPLQAGLGWVVRFDKGDFRGRGPLLIERDRGVHRCLRGFVMDGRQIPRADHGVLHEGKVVGEVTSGNFSPILERGIGLAFLPPAIAEDAEIEIDIRGRPAPAVVVKPPFLHK